MKKAIVVVCASVSLTVFAGLRGRGTGKLVPLMQVV
jgi:hypothetical protein